MKDDAVVDKPEPGARTDIGSRFCTPLYFSSAEQDKLLQALVADFSARPDKKWPTSGTIHLRAQKYGYNLTRSWTAAFREKLKDRAPHLFAAEIKNMHMSDQEVDDIATRLIAIYKSEASSENITAPDILKRCHGLGYAITRFWSIRLRRKLMIMAPELATQPGRKGDLPRPSAATTSQKKTKELLRCRVEPETYQLFCAFSKATCFEPSKHGSAFSLLMKVVAQGILSHQLNLTHSLQQARTLRPEDILAVARVVGRIDWSVPETPRQ